ncbi:MAG: hypothetical protein NT131_03040 [Methanomassiliicoccales archaeon]|nr:hypothetical protein [Methanomassiliicoccales archaeon]
MKTMVIQVRTGTMMNMDTNIAVKLVQAALDKGYGVRIFGYGEAVTLVKGNQAPVRVRRGLRRPACRTRHAGIRTGPGLQCIVGG